MRIALLGAGRIGQLHGRLVSEQPDVDEVIVYDVDLTLTLPPGLSASAQSLYSALGSGVVMGLALLLAGPLYGAFGGGAFAAMALFSAGGMAAASPRAFIGTWPRRTASSTWLSTTSARTSPGSSRRRPTAAWSSTARRE